MTDEYIEFTCGKCFHEYISISPIAECPVCLPTSRPTQPDRPQKQPKADVSDWDWKNIRMNRGVRDSPKSKLIGDSDDLGELHVAKSQDEGVKYDDGKPRWDLLPL